MDRSMSNVDDSLIGRIALFRGFLHWDDLQECLKIQALEEPPRDLGDILMARGHLDPQALQTIRMIRRKKARGMAGEQLCEEGEERRFGRIALERGWIDPDELESAILEKERLARRNLRFRIGEILVERGAIEPEQVREILAEQGLEVRICRACDLAFNVRAPRGGGARRCPSCGEDLVATPFLQGIDVDGVLA